MARRKKTEETPETESPGAGHNDQSGGPSDSIILDYARRIIAKNEEKKDAHDVLKSLVSEVRSIYKSAKKAGINTDMLQIQIANREREPEAVLQDTKDFLRFGNLFAMPLTQDDLFPDDVLITGLDPTSAEGRKQAVFDAGNAGLRAGKAGFEIDANPFHQVQDNEEFAAWSSNWHAGQAHLAKGLTQPTVTGMRGNGANPEDGPGA